MTERIPARIRSIPCPNCILCGERGRFIHVNQPDRLFAAPGLWSLKQCDNLGCRLIWLDPMPLEADIGLAYVAYHTHALAPAEEAPGLLQKVSRSAARRRINRQYGYTLADDFLPPLIADLAGLLPQVRARADDEVRFLPAVTGGELLDIGCGRGDWLSFMSGLGWKTVGIDFDAQAVDVCCERGLSALCGTLEEQQFSSDRFDAITLHHVIEHLYDPIATMRECRRILKPSGRLVLFTPNGSCLGHRLYGAHWRGLEPPRHLHIFSAESLSALVERTGFERPLVLPRIVPSVMLESHRLVSGRSFPSTHVYQSTLKPLLELAISGLEHLAARWRPSLADCLAVVAQKRQSTCIDPINTSSPSRQQVDA